MAIEHFQLNHLSASTINSWIARPLNFYNSKILRKPFVTNPNMCRGKAVEDVINLWAAGIIDNNVPVAEIHALAFSYYDDHMAPYVASVRDYFKSADEIRMTIPGLAVLAYQHYTIRWEGRRPGSQAKININLPGVTLPVIGFLDYRIDGEVSDCKIVGKSAKKLSQDYCIAGAIYKLATGDKVTYDLFVANKTPKHVQLEVTPDDYKFGLSYAIAAAKIIEEVKNCEDPVRVSHLMLSFPNLDEMYDKVEIKEAAERWGIQVRPDGNEEE